MSRIVLGSLVLGGEFVSRSAATPLDAVYLTYWSRWDPLTESQSIPVLRSLVERGYKLALVTYERTERKAAPGDVAHLAEEGISWFPLRYHRSPPLFSTLWDAFEGFRLCAALQRRHGVKLFHSRGTVPAASAAAASAMTGAKFFYDADGPLSEEYVDAGRWSRSSVSYHVTRTAEERCLRLADKVAVLTDVRRRELDSQAGCAIEVLPCAVDTSHFTYSLNARKRLRQDLGLVGTVMVYSGKWGGWYAVEEMMEFVASARKYFPQLHLLVLTRDQADPFREAAARHDLEGILIVRAATREEMPKYLSAADVGLSFVRPLPSKKACSPVKNGEYLASGLPIVTPQRIGDYSEVVALNRVGVVLSALESAAYDEPLRELKALLSDRDLRQRCRAIAEREVGLEQVVAPRYHRIYSDLIGPATPNTRPRSSPIEATSDRAYLSR